MAAPLALSWRGDDLKIDREKARVDAEEERRQYAEQESNAGLRYVQWRRAALWSTSIFICNVVAIVPFLAGHSLYAYWDSVGKNLVRLAMGLLPVTAFCVVIAYLQRAYVRDLKEIHRKYGPKIK